MSKVKLSPVAASIPFDNTTNDFQSTDVQGAIEETLLLAEGVPRAPIFFGIGIQIPYIYIFSGKLDLTNFLLLLRKIQN